MRALFDLLGGCLLLVASLACAQEVNPPVLAPEFTERATSSWINSKPLTMKDLRGQVVLMDFWTFGCWNCYRSFPWLTALEQRYSGEGLTVIGIHTPEFAHEKVRASVERKVKEFGLHHPVMMDNDFEYWNAIGNRYWPTYYLIDKQGRVRANFVGEIHKGDRRALAIEKEVNALLAEP